MSATVLIVDDSASVRRYCQEELEGEGYRVLLARNGEEALHMLAQVRPDLAILDLHMPRCGGMTTLWRIRRMYPGLPVVLHSSSFRRDVRRDAALAAFLELALHSSASGDGEPTTDVACIAKSEDLTALKSAIAALLGNGRILAFAR